MSRSDDRDVVSSETRDDIQRFVVQFENAWKDALEHGNPFPDLDHSLPAGLDVRFRAKVLCALVPVDLEHCLKAGQSRNLDFYLAHYKDLGTAETVSADLIFEEYRILADRGDEVKLEDYHQRYPAQFPQLKKLVDNYALARPTPTSPSMTEVYAPPSTPAASGPGGGGAALEFDTGAVINGYEMVAELGDGGFGEVWKVRKQNTGKLFALKRSKSRTNSPEVKRIHNSLELFKDLQNPWLLLPLDWFEYGRRLCIVMELADGGSLKERLAACRTERLETGQRAGKGNLGGIPVEELLGYIEGVAQALDYLHGLKQPIQHRDIKAQNILLVGGYAKLADFDLAKEMSDQRDVTNTRGGSLAYKAPEMFNDQVVHRKSDQYCFAYTYAEL